MIGKEVKYTSTVSGYLQPGIQTLVVPKSSKKKGGGAWLAARLLRGYVLKLHWPCPAN